MSGWSLFARSLVMILIEEFNKEIGLKSLIVVAPSTFGISVMKESFMLLRQMSSEWKSRAQVIEIIPD